MPVIMKKLQKMAIFMGFLCTGGGTFLYYFIQKTFAGLVFYQEALEQLRKDPAALEALGAPPLKVHYIRLTDKSNVVGESQAQIKIPVSGTRSAGYLHVSSERALSGSSWSMKEVTLQLRSGQNLTVYLSSMKNAPEEDL